MTSRRHAFQYATLRAVPRVERGEFVNVGVIFYCQALDFLRATVSVDPDRLRALAPDVDLDAVRTSAQAVVDACSEPVGSARENTGLATRFGILTAPRSTVVQPSPVHAGVTRRPEEALGQLVAKLVGSREEGFSPAGTSDPWYVVVSGAPASGKSTLARQLAPALGLPLLAKDTLKDGLLSVLEAPDVATSEQLGRASVEALLAVAGDVGSCVVESVWHRSRAVAQLSRLPGALVEVFCSVQADVLQRRYRERSGSRHAGYFDDVRSPETLWNADTNEPVAGGWPVLTVDTAAVVDVTALAGQVRAAGRTA